MAYQKFSFASQYSVGILNFCQQATIAGTLLGTMLVAGKAVTQGRMNIGGGTLFATDIGLYEQRHV